MSNQIEQVKQLHGQLTNMKDGLKAALPSHISVEKFIRVAQTAILSNAKLLQANRTALFAACTQAAQDGLLPDGQEAALVPYGDDVQYQPMIKGICKKARNSGEIKVIDAVDVYSGDDYDAWTDETGPHFKHKKNYGERGQYVLTYAYAVLKDGGIFFEEVHADDMAKIQKQSRGKNTPWTGPFASEMRRKSALRRLLKYRVPTSTDLDFTLAVNDDPADFEEPKTEPEPAVEKAVDNPKDATKPNNLAAALAPEEPPAAAEELPEGFDPEEEIPI